jgi:hypothetical protein
VQKFIRIVLIAGGIAAAVAFVLVAPVGLWAWYKTAQVERFYQDHPLLGAMREGQRGSVNDSGPARQALLQRVPLGTDKAVAVAVFSKEGFDCKAVAAAVNCQIGAPAVMNDTTWIVSLLFRPDGRLGDARVATWAVSL